MSDDRCKETVYPNERWGSFHPHACHRNAWRDGYCKQHHPDTVKARNAAAEKRFEEKQKRQPWYLLKEAQKRIAQLEAEIAELRRAGATTQESR